MRFLSGLVVAVSQAAIVASQDAPKPDAEGRYTIEAKGIKAQVRNQ
jgi:hypothetical protein